MRLPAARRAAGCSFHGGLTKDIRAGGFWRAGGVALRVKLQQYLVMIM